MLFFKKKKSLPKKTVKSDSLKLTALYFWWELKWVQPPGYHLPHWNKAPDPRCATVLTQLPENKALDKGGAGATYSGDTMPHPGAHGARRGETAGLGTPSGLCEGGELCEAGQRLRG